MKKTYEKPQAAKSNATLQLLAAQAIPPTSSTAI